MSKIKIMDWVLANKIAAGEVVEKCSSVVKELTENAIDAKSASIKVELIEAGTKEIKVTDDGIGMEKEDAKLAFERHATSKLLDEDDLYRINTLGFRGEALPSIASVSRVSIKTSTGNLGTEINIEGGKTISVKNGDARKGTIITIRDLFYNTPARLKHMKSLYTELASITEYMNKLALSYPNIKFILTNNGNELLNTDGKGNLHKTISSIFGLQTASKMIKINGENEDYKVNGFISLPEIQRSSRNNMIIIVNGRIVRNNDLNRAINDAYHNYKPDNRYPIVVINIEAPATLIDVNIHPTKMDIKFSKREELELLLSTLIKEALKPKTLIPKIEENEAKIVKNGITEAVKVEPQKQYEEITLNFDRVAEDETVYSEELIVNNFYEETKEENEAEKFPELYPIGSVHGTYIICQNEKGMYLMDQHAAKERINYEDCLNNLTNPKKQTISLLIPITIELTNSEFLIVKENFEFLKNMGFEIDEFGIHSIIVKAHPLWISKYNEEQAIRKMIDLTIDREKNFDLGRFNDHVAATMACKMSIKANDSITIEEMENLLDDLKKCDNPFHCPHGRPVLIYYSKEDLQKLFKRSGFESKK